MTTMANTPSTALIGALMQPYDNWGAGAANKTLSTGIGFGAEDDED